MTKIIYILLWWPSWYLLFFMHGTQGELRWVVTEKVSSYGQSLTLFCSVNDCCNKKAGWSSKSRAIFIDIKKYPDDPNLKYGVTYNESGFGLIIRDLSETDVNKTYECVYGFEISTHQYLLQEDVFIKDINVDESCNNTRSPDRCKDPMSSCTEVVSGDYKCSCNPGFYSNGGTCNIQINVDESCNNTRSPNQCKDPMSSCTEVDSGDYKCSCNPGYYNNGGTCNIQINVDESCNNTEPPDQCKDPMSNCTEVVSGDYKCSCNPGYYNNGGTCNIRVPDKGEDKENNTVAIVVTIVVVTIVVIILVGAIIGIKYRIIKKKQEQRGTDAEMAPLNDTENQQVPVIELTQTTFTVYETEEVSIICNEIRNNKNYGEPYWERIDGNGKSCNLTIIEGKYGLKRDPPCLTILDVQMSDSGDYYCCIEYSTSDVKKTVKSEKAHLTIKKIIELKQDMFTVYETEEVSIKCNEIKNKKRNDQVFWEWIDENKKMTRRVKKGDGFDLETDPPCLKILDVQMSNSGDYYCCIEYSTSDVKKTVKREKAHLTVKKKKEVEDLYKGITEKYGIEPKIPKALLDDKTFFRRLIEECRKDIEHHSGVNSRGNEYFPAMLLELVSKYQRQQHTEIVDTILNNMSKTLKAQSPSTVVLLCHRSVKSAMIKADEEDYKEQKEVFGKFIEENKFYYNDRFLEQYKYKSRQ